VRRLQGHSAVERGVVDTESAHAGAGDEVIMSIAGHVSRALYSHVTPTCGWKRSDARSTRSPRGNGRPIGSAKGKLSGSRSRWSLNQLWFSDRRQRGIAPSRKGRKCASLQILRHTQAVILRAESVGDLATVSERMDHSSVAATADICAHANPRQGTPHSVIVT
jgi:hypothetical protein